MHDYLQYVRLLEFGSRTSFLNFGVGMGIVVRLDLYAFGSLVKQ